MIKNFFNPDKPEHRAALKHLIEKQRRPDWFVKEMQSKGVRELGLTSPGLLALGSLRRNYY